MRNPYGYFVSCFLGVLSLSMGVTHSYADIAQKDLAVLAQKVAADQGVPSSLVQAVITVESGWRRDATNGTSIGLMQITPATARSLGYRGTVKGLFDPATNLSLGVRYLALAYARAGGDLCGTVSRYQSGIETKKPNAANRNYCARAKRLMEASAVASAN